MQELDANRGGELVTPNLDHLRRCRLDPSFAGLVAQSQVVVADGMPLVWASRLQGTPLPERVAGSDLISSVSAAAAERGRSVFFLGGAPGSAQAAAEVLVSRHPTLKIAGTHCPPMGFELNPEAMAEIIDRLTMAKPDIVYVALGSPKQEHLIHELREWLPRSWWLGVGYSFSFLAGEGSRAPLWMQRTGLEWLHRLAREPRRLARRYLLEGLPHAARLLTSTTFNGITGRHAAATPAAPKASQSLPQQHRTGNNPDRQELEALIYSSFTRGLGVELERPPRQIAKAHRPRHRTDAGTGRISAFVLLGGTLRPSPFLTAVRRSILDMPIQDGRRLLSNWQHQTSELAKAEGLADLPLRVLIDHESPVPAGSPASISGTISIERDAARYRGTGGLLRDLAEDYDDNDFLLVASGGQLLTQHLTDLVRELHETNADVSFIAHQDGTPSSVMLIRCETLRGISASGYVDLKEQALPVIARNFKVAHVEHAWPTCLPLRTHKDYLAALRWWHLHRSFQSADDMLQDTDSLLDHHSYRFSIVEHGAIVDPTACLQDCVVLRGARVGPGAVAVRSVLCAGSVLAASETAVDQLVSARSRAQTAKTQRILQLSRN
jgi:N-acetylglucosaminyldiphosphoundecaprenol N-acetyl-beta-D-mannosaminyltransferase